MSEEVINISTKRSKKKEKKNYHYCKLLSGQDKSYKEQQENKGKIFNHRFHRVHGL